MDPASPGARPAGSLDAAAASAAAAPGNPLPPPRSQQQQLGLHSLALLPMGAPVDGNTEDWLNLCGSSRSSALLGASPRSNDLAAAADRAAEEALAAAAENVMQHTSDFLSSPPTANGDATNDGGATTWQKSADKPAAASAGGGDASAAGAAAAAPAAPPPSAAALAAAPPAPEPLHFIMYRQEIYSRPCRPAEQPPRHVHLRRWMLQDSHARWHLAVDTQNGDTPQEQHRYAAVPPFSVVRPLDCSSLTEVEAYLLEFIPLHRRAAAQAAATAQVQAAATAQAQAQAQLQAATAVPGWPGAPGAGGGGLLQHYAAALQPAGAKRRPGRPRIYPVGQKPPKKQKGGAAAAAAAAAATTAAAADSSGAAPAEASAAAFALPTLFSLPVICGASGAAAGDAGVGGALALAGSAGGGAPKQRARRLTLAEAAFIGDLEQRRQVVEERKEAVLSELGLLKAQCGVDFSLTLITQEREVEVLTCATANVQAVKVVRNKRDIPRGEVELPPGVAAAAAAAAQPKPDEEEGADADAALLSAGVAVAAGALPALPPAAFAAAQRQQRQQQQQPYLAMLMDQQQQQQLQQKLEEGEEDTKRFKHASPGLQPGLTNDDDVRHLVPLLQHNSGAYMQGAWRRQPYDAAGYVEIDGFVVAADCGEARDAAALPAKLQSSLGLPAAAAAAAGDGAPGAAAGGAAAAVEARAPPALASGSGDSGGGGMEEHLVLEELPLGLAAGEVEVRDTWGLDPFTRKNVWAALGRCPELKSRGGQGLDAARSAFIDAQLLPALNRRGDDGWDVTHALEQLSRCGGDVGGLDAATTRAAAALVLRVLHGVEAYHNGGRPRDPEEREHFRVHPKGEGVVLLRAGGLGSNAFVGEYFGELYAAWRWLERDHRSACRLTMPGPKGHTYLRMGATDEFFNIALERPPKDVKGYDVLFVNAALKGNFTSRLGHSCDPNCKTVPMVAGGRVTIGVWTTRPVAPGEELTLDWSCETENEKEYQHAVCLCGSAACRGSFLYLSRGDTYSPLQQYSHTHHTFLHRQHLLLLAAQQAELSAVEAAALQRLGIGDWLLTDGAPGEGGVLVPSWLRRWAALVAQFIEEEARELPKLLQAPQSAGRRGPGRPPQHGPPCGAGSEEESDDGEEDGDVEIVGSPTAASRSSAQVAAVKQEAWAEAEDAGQAAVAAAVELAVAAAEHAQAQQAAAAGGQGPPALAALAAFGLAAPAPNVEQPEGAAVHAAAPPAAMETDQREPAEEEEEENKEDAEEQEGDVDVKADVELLRHKRLQALAFALDRAKLVLRHQEGEEARCAPLRLLSEEEAVEFLWTGDDSVAYRSVASLASFTEHTVADGLTASRQPRKAAKPSWLDNTVDTETLEPVQPLQERRLSQRSPATTRRHAAAMLAPLSTGPSSSVQRSVSEAAGSKRGQSEGPAASSAGQEGQEAEQQLRVAAMEVDGEEEQQQQTSQQQAQEQAGGAPADGAQAGGCKGAVGEGSEGEQDFDTLADQLQSIVEGTEVTTLASAQAGLRRLASLLRAAGVGHAGLHDLLLMYASVERWVAAVEYELFSPELANGEEGERVRGQHLWALLSAWQRAGSGVDFTPGLSAERRGCFNLPDVECAYLPAFSSGAYARKGARRTLLRVLATTPRAAWPNATPFTFRNSFKIYGSPQLDAMLSGSTDALQGLVRELERAF
ncbi:SET domain [Micractinium conductrix]|uniref:SET domain n=1 Tax=Micractinium conductrix TaxID=554055 RepID=A0A2P6VAS6_9CHLO|nr:SET domain [Micractinium conductrix]|eukprot:PSC71151.1 SET domain [Micractinium conductrix]